MKTIAYGDKLSPKERVLRTFKHESTDRVPVDYYANPGIDQKLKNHFGLKADDDEGLKKLLGIDFRGVSSKYEGKMLHAEKHERNVDPQWGWVTKYIEHESGGYWDFCDFPLIEADEETVAKWPMPSPDDFDYSKIPIGCETYRDYAVFVGHAGLGCVMNTAGFLRGMEQVFVDLVLDEPAGLLLIDRMLAIQLEVVRREIEVAKGGIDFMWIGEDLGTQHGPLISLETFRKHIKPRQKPFFDLAKAYNLPVMLHTCGSSSWSYEDYIEMGLTAVDTLQPEAKNMSPEYLKKIFANRLAYHGCISTCGPVAFGTPEDTVKYCQRTLDVMMPGGGYCFAPTHSLQDNSLLENVIAMYETAHKYGKY